MLRDIIIEKFNEALIQSNVTTSYISLSDDVVLLETDLDSLGFAILITLLEEELDYDPFQLMDEPVYPRTFGEFVKIYEHYGNK